MPDARSDLFLPALQGAVSANPLSHALEYLVFRSWIPGPFELSAPWGIDVETRLGWFYVAGEPCRLETEGQTSPLLIAAGDLIVVAQGHRHCLRDAADSPSASIRKLLGSRHFARRDPLVHGGGGAVTRLNCGCFFAEGVERSFLHAIVPAVVHVKGEAGQAAPYVKHILRLLELAEADREPCASIITNHLVRALLLKALQGYVSELPDGRAGWLKALADPEIGRALGLMHAEPNVPWTVAALAERVAMSRSTFAARFTGVVGKPPLEYLTDARMQRACLLLRTSRFELKEVAAQVGYESASAFSKAFAHWAGVAPGAYRRAGAAAAHAFLSDVPPM